MPTERTRVALVDDRLDLRTGRLAPRLTDRGPDRAAVALVATTALLLGGDHVALQIVVGSDRHLRIADVAATVAYHGRGAQAVWEAEIDLAAGATLLWDAEPLVLSAGADVRRSLTVRAAPGARLLLRDQVVLGRTGEPGGALACRTRMSLGGVPALAEDLRLGPERAAVGVLGPARVLDTAVALGWRPPAPEHGTLFELDAPGALVRDLAAEAHLSSIPGAWAGWRGLFTAPDVAASRS